MDKLPKINWLITSGGVIIEAIIKNNKYIFFLWFDMKFFIFDVLCTKPNKVQIIIVLNKHILNMEVIKLKYSFNFASKKKFI